MPAFEWVHVQLHQQKGMISLSPPTICNSADVPPGTKRSYRVTADALGRWAYHCHLLYHMEMGMFREVRVEE
ncbi:multicopper oxidase domain-containing protein [Klebsiella pneumoniae]|uniref:multicopper oxidase domain-containing protein n=1 Tax=Klebsiella pneumoniae TaxID=573 RepID=UPI0021E6224C|nr:multicopper oxidase domain-containing protein [Klebsiella pneumoniae]